MADTLEFAIKEKVEDLKQKILAKHPLMPTLLQEIHTAILKNPEQVTLLAEEEIAVIINGLELHTNTHLMVAAAIKTPAKSVTSRIKNLGLDAF